MYTSKLWEQKCHFVGFNVNNYNKVQVLGFHCIGYTFGLPHQLKVMHQERTWAPSLSFRMHSMVLMVITTDSDPSLVQGTWIRSSWIWPLMNVKGSFNSYAETKS